MLNTAPDYKAILADSSKHRLQEKWLPEKLDAEILDLGCGWGTMLLSLWATDYRKLTGVDLSASMCAVAGKELPPEINIICADAVEFLKDKKECYELITIFDVVEHMRVEKAIELLGACRKALTANGAVVIRVPNMANILAAYSRYMDVTHLVGYTEWSLFQLLDEAGFKDHRMIHPSQKWKELRTLTRPWRGLGLREWLNTVLHRFLFALAGIRVRPATFAINLTVQSWKR
ncbi:class I SAM-dependent methyltransferase [Thermodesulfovibrionales bacterium]|nr:class I SAM-dependent methyltransferase [Thermodesulfovibrionales bacterium]